MAKWKFKKFDPEPDDIDAAVDASDGYFRRVEPTPGQIRGDELVSAFFAGFYRGADYMRHKIRDGENDKADGGDIP